MDVFPSHEEQEAKPELPSVQRPSLVPTSERDYIKRYTRVFRAADTAMFKLFSDVDMLTAEGALIKVPLIFGTQERAVAAMFGKSLQATGDVVRIKLPMMAISAIGFDIDRTRYTFHEALSYDAMNARSERVPHDVRIGVSRGIPINRIYTLLVWAKFQEDANQILEQAILKFSPVAYVEIPGAFFENMVTLDAIANNLNWEIADQDLRIIKYELSMTLQTYVPQPFKRTKSVRKVKTEMEIQPADNAPHPPGADLINTQYESIDVRADDEFSR